MNQELFDLLNETPLCLEILQTYEEQTEQHSDADSSRWQTRVAAGADEGAPADGDETRSQEWSSAHGLLIAYGLLDIEIASREAGIQYCLTRDGRQTLKLYRQLQQSSDYAESA